MATRPSIVLDPPAMLKFRGPFNVVQTTELKLQNPSESTVLFKIKTTAPKRYCVRPNSGSVAPNATVSVSIMLQPTTNDLEDRSKHKFMVQTIAVSADASPENYDNLWKDLLPGQMGESRLKCAFEDVEAASENGTMKSGDGSDLMPASMYWSVASDVEAQENQRLRKQVSQLNDECARLRESELRLRKLQNPATTQDDAADSSTIEESHGITLSLKALFWLAFIAFICGVFMGIRLL